MIKSAKVAAAIVLFMGAVPAPAQIVSGELMFDQRSGYWSSFLLVLPSAANTRASAASTDGTATTLAIDFTPPNCNPVLKFLFPMGSAAPKDNTRVDLSITMRTDSGARVEFSAASMVTMGDTTGMIYVMDSGNLLGQVGEMSRGQVLRVKTVFGDDTTGAIYNTYSLMGMTAAYRRAEGMCKNPASFRR
ncbi:hypothetical protein [Castellaniella ginsengisoli]|uniref:Uncharacterized protein n=1 Tax=Castellaniella ginsengisoli TaxID=546114 RepID=A0AB39D841_9BURK